MQGCRGGRWLAALAAGILGFGASFAGAAPILDLVGPPAELGLSSGAAQRHSLDHVFYRGNPLPPLPDDTELSRIRGKLAAASPLEVAELRRLFGDDDELLAYAIRDSDGDGVRDFRVSEYRGRFFEGDLDLDGDGVDNVFDAAPYDPGVGGTDTDGDGAPDVPGSFADLDHDSVPDHLDHWVAGSELDQIQSVLFQEFGIILVERSGLFTLELAQAVDDVVRLVYVVAPVTLRTVAAESRLLLADDPDDHGLMLGQTRTLTLCTAGLAGAAPLVLFGLVVHEVDHAFQLALDYDPAHPMEENRREHFPHGLFAESLASFGWTPDARTGAPGDPHHLFTPQFAMTGPDYRYLGATTRWWTSWLERIEAAVGDGYLRDRRLVRLGVVGPYSLTTPWEWRADHAAASLLNRMERYLHHHPDPTVVRRADALAARMLEETRAVWPAYDYRNAGHTPIALHMTEELPLTPAALTRLTDRYVVPLFVR